MINKNPIIIECDADFTPIGKRTVRIVQTSRGGRQIRGYVSGRIYKWGFPSIERAIEWRDNTRNLCPQPWEQLL